MNLINLDKINELRGEQMHGQEEYGYQPENYPGTDDVTGMFKAILDKINYLMKCMASYGRDVD